MGNEKSKEEADQFNKAADWLYEWEKKNNPFFPNTMNFDRTKVIEIISEFPSLSSRPQKEEGEEAIREAHKAGAESFRLALIERLNLNYSHNQVSIPILYEVFENTDAYIDSLQGK